MDLTKGSSVGSALFEMFKGVTALVFFHSLSSVQLTSFCKQAELRAPRVFALF